MLSRRRNIALEEWFVELISAERREALLPSRGITQESLLGPWITGGFPYALLQEYMHYQETLSGDLFGKLPTLGARVSRSLQAGGLRSQDLHVLSSIWAIPKGSLG